MGKFMGIKMGARRALFSRVGCAVLAGATLVAGCNYVANSNHTAEEPKPALVQRVDMALVMADPGAYLDAGAEYFTAYPEMARQYSAELSGYMRAANQLEALSMDDRMYLFEDNASRVPVDYGIEVCEQSVVSRASEERALEHVLDSVRQTDARNYGQIVVAMADELGSELYGLLRQAFEK